jgi:plastocyanin
MRRIRGVVVIAAALSLFAAAGCGGYGGGGNDEGEGGSTTIAGQQTESHGMKDVSGETGKVEIEMYDDYFEPTVLEGKPGQMVTLELKNEGNNPHTLTISDQSVDKEIQPGDEGEVDVTFPQSGQLEFVCRFHQSKGMVGALQAGSSGGSSGGTTTTDSSSKY